MSEPTGGVLLLRNRDVKSVLDVPRYVDALEQMFGDLARSEAENMSLYRFYTPLQEVSAQAELGGAGPPLDVPHHWFNLHAGVVPRQGYAALRVDSGTAVVEERFGLPRLEFPDELVGLVLLFRLADGTLDAIISDHYINPIRVAATTAVGVRHLAQEPVTTFGLYGTGWQARWHLTLCAAILPDLERVVVYSPDEEHRSRFVRMQKDRFPTIDFVAADRPEQAAQGMDLVIAATNSVAPVLEAKWLKSGAHVACIAGGDRWDRGKEIGEDVAARANVVIANRAETVRRMDQRALLDAVDVGELDFADIQNLGDAVNGTVRHRDRGDITLHFNNEGLGVQFAAVGAEMYRSALEAGVGTRLPYTWRGRDA